MLMNYLVSIGGLLTFKDFFRNQKLDSPSNDKGKAAKLMVSYLQNEEDGIKLVIMRVLENLTCDENSTRGTFSKID